MTGIAATAVLLAFSTTFCFVLVFGLRIPWWRSRMGRSTMAKTGGVLLVTTTFLYRVREVVAVLGDEATMLVTVGWLLIAAAMAYRLVFVTFPDQVDQYELNHPLMTSREKE